MSRRALMERVAAVLDRRFVALQAPAGFGKTTLLAEFCGSQRRQGVAVAWVSLDEDDAPSVFGSYLASAFEAAGLDLSSLKELDPWSSSPATYQLGMLARAIELSEKPCLLVLDELDRVPQPTVELIQRLFEHGPPNLHFAVAFRSNPGLDLAMQVFRGEGIVVGVEELRFSRDEIDRFFGGTLSRRQLDEAERVTAGWPVALLLYRNAQAAGGEQTGGAASRLTLDFVRVRLLRGLSPVERAFVCELAVFDWIEPGLVDEVLGSTDASVRIGSLSALDGLLEPVGEAGAVQRLHPLVRDYCADLLAVESPERKRALHNGIAEALAHRGRLIPAWRHARAGGVGGLLGALIERAGVYEMWLQKGVTRLYAANEFLTPEILAAYPRLVLLRSAVHRMSLKVEEAVALYESVERTTDGFTRDREGGDAKLLAVDRLFLRVVMDGGSSLAFREECDSIFPEPGMDDSDERGRFLLGARHMVLCGLAYEQARFEDCREHAVKARVHLGNEKKYGNLVLDLYLGMAAMASARVREAVVHYANARRGTRKYFASDPCLAVCVDAVTIEFDLECNRERTVDPSTLRGLAVLRAIWTDIDMAAIAVSAELTFRQQDGEAALELLAETVKDVEALRSPSLFRHVAGLLVSYLSESDLADEAEAAWRDHGLPEEPAEILDVSGQPWRTMESLACARIRLLAVRGKSEAAEDLAARLSAFASRRGLLRTALRGLALSMAVAEQAGSVDRALERLTEYLGLVGDSGYVGPLLRDRHVVRGLLERLLVEPSDDKTRVAAESMIGLLDAKKEEAPVFSPRELQVLDEVRQGLRNREIADRLGISQPGVRFHLSNIYRKTGVSRRDEAVRAAQSLGVLD